MPRLPRIYVEGALYYVSCYGVHQENIFRQKKDYLMYLELLKKYKEQYNFKLFAWCLMPTHLHLLLELSREGISEIMHDINSAYTKYFNGCYQRKGHLFRDRFRSVIVEKEPYILNLISYLHLAPVQAGLVNRFSDYPFSSHLPYLYYSHSENVSVEEMNNIINLETEVQEVAGLLSRASAQKKDYPDFMNTLTGEKIEQINRQLQRARILGSKEFTERVKAEIKHKKFEEKREQKRLITPRLLSSTVIVATLLVSAGGLWLYFYVQRNISLKEKEIYTRLKREQQKQEQMDLILTELEGTEWTIEVRPRLETARAYARFDKLIFENGKISSRYFLKQGFSSTNYTFTILDDGTLLWETMQIGPGGTTSWRAEATPEGKMKGILSLRPIEGAPQDFSFISLNLKRKE